MTEPDPKRPEARPADTASPAPWLAHYDREVPSRLEYAREPLFAHLDRAAAAAPERAAIVFKNYRLSYRDLHAQAEILAANLRAVGVSPGSRVGIMLPNLPQTVLAYWAVLKAGAICVMTNPLYMEHELTHQLGDAGCEHLIVLDALWDKVWPLRRKLPVKRYIVTRLTEGLRPPLSWLAGLKLRRAGKRPALPRSEQVLRWRDLAHGRERYSHSEIDPERDLALLQYTGGTTGVAKGCMITHANLDANLTQCRAMLHAVGHNPEVFLGVLPYFHVYGLTVCLNFPTALGATLAPFPRFDPAEVLDAITRIRPTIFPGAPAVYMALMQQKRFSQTDFSSLTYCVSGSAPMPVEVARRFERETGARILEGYGLTEASPVTHLNPLAGVRKAGTIGLPFPDTLAAVVDKDTGGDPLPAGQDGELVIKGPQVMTGYWNRPEDTAASLRDGWLYTGDIARMDEQGYFTIVDRKKDMIISGGYNIYPREVDEVLYEHPLIKEAVTVGVPSRTRGESVKAFVVIEPGSHLDAHEVIAFCKERLAAYKVPRRVEFRATLPKNLVGKVLRRALREEEVSRTADKGEPQS